MGFNDSNKDDCSEAHSVGYVGNVTYIAEHHSSDGAAQHTLVPYRRGLSRLELSAP